MSCEINEKICDKCEVNYPISSYRKYNETSIGKTCKKCLNELDKIRKKNLAFLPQNHLRKQSALVSSGSHLHQQRHVVTRFPVPLTVQ